MAAAAAAAAAAGGGWGGLVAAAGGGAGGGAGAGGGGGGGGGGPGGPAGAPGGSSKWTLAVRLLGSGGHGAVGAAVWAGMEAWDRMLPWGSASPQSATFALFPPALHRAVVTGCSALARVVPAARGVVTPDSVGILLASGLCGVLACLLDADHFIAAGSLRPRDAGRLDSRPWGHAVATVVVASGAAAAIAPGTPWWLLVAVAWGSHQLRDATRRGLWCWPLPSTPPLPFPVYVTILAAAPLLIAAGRWALAGHGGGGGRSRGGGGGGGRRGGGPPPPPPPPPRPQAVKRGVRLSLVV